MMAATNLLCILYIQYKNGAGVYYKIVDAPLHMDTQQVAEDLAAVVPAEIAGLIVDHAVD